MAFQEEDGFGSLFKNKDKKEAKHPDLKGKMKLGGVEHDVAMWRRVGKESGEPYFRVSIKPSTYRPGQPKPATRRDAEDIFS